MFALSAVLGLATCSLLDCIPSPQTRHGDASVRLMGALQQSIPPINNFIRVSRQSPGNTVADFQRSVRLLKPHEHALPWGPRPSPCNKRNGGSARPRDSPKTWRRVSGRARILAQATWLQEPSLLTPRPQGRLYRWGN